ncbi:MAG: response regulator [Nitrospirae bacterium]|nr:response regulator [Nitrospirota bacterium]
MSRDRLKVLVVDDEAAMREVLEMRLKQWGFEVVLAKDAAEARALAEERDPDAVISDLVLPDSSGLDLVKSLQGGEAHRPVIMITAHGAVDIAVEAMKLGAMDFLTKPIDYEQLKATLLAAKHELERRVHAQHLEQTLADGAGLGLLIGASKPMREVYELLRVLARSEASAIITGESGTGKELAARTVHDLSARSNEPFIAVNTAAIAEGITESELFGHERGAFTGATSPRPGYFEMADRGTLFLDEISEMPGALQPKLLRVLEDGRVRRVGGRSERAVDVRTLAATNRDPDSALDSGLLRGDLYYRLCVFTIEMPPLRNRPEDISLLTQHFISQFNAKHGTAVEGVSEATLDRLGTHDWPGNVRELRNVIERGIILARQGWIETVHLPPFIRGGEIESRSGLVLPEGTTVAAAEKMLILQTLERVGNNKAKAARSLGVDVKTIRNKLRAWGMTGQDE